MRDVNLSSVDLNLLLVVAMVLEEGSATRAATKLHVTQSAVSNALRRARDVFADPLVVREAHGLTPSPRGRLLLPALRAWLEEAQRLISSAPAFDPSTSSRTFTIACSDSVALVLLQPLLRRMQAVAPHAKLRLLTLDRLLAEDALSRGDADLLIGMPPVLPAGQTAELVYRDPMVCIVRLDNPRVRTRLTLETYASLPHVDLALFGAVDDRVDRALGLHGRSRVVSVALPHFAIVPLAVMEIDGVATVARRLARVFAAQLPLKVVKPPVDLQEIEISQIWHRRSEGDEAIGFLRALVRDLGAATDVVAQQRPTRSTPDRASKLGGHREHR
jgi:DNA-binding transcriptional LysR family regulator